MRARTDIDTRLGALADAQHGVVRRAQLLELGLGTKAISYRVRRAQLRPIHRGVYAVGHRRLRQEGVWLAAAWACGDGAVISHRSAAAIWGLLAGVDAGLLEVSMPRASPRAPRGLRVRRHAALLEDERTVRDGIPVTTVARTLLDLAVVLAPWSLRRAVEQAENLELFDLGPIERVLAAHRGRPGAPALGAVVADLGHHGTTLTRTELEARFLQGCIDHGLPRPIVNRSVDEGELDFRWPAARLAVETNGFRYHRSRAAFERDHVKRFALEGAGYRVVSLTWRQVTETPDAVFARVSELLASR